MSTTRALPIVDPELQRDLRTLAVFIRTYCQGRHPDAVKQVIRLRTHDLEAIAGERIILCGDCAKLLTHAFVKRTHCPMDPKPTCKHCPRHCYHPDYRAKIREVMKYSGMRLVLRGRLDYLLHLLF